MELIGVIGAGAMGSGIAQVAASAGSEVVLVDNRAKALIGARDLLLSNLNKLAEKGKISDTDAKAIFGRIHLSENIADFKDCQLVIEAIVEQLAPKKETFSRLEKIVSPSCILATNTSSLSVTSIASACVQPGRVVGIHFFNPAPLMRLVEIIPGLQTSDAVRKSAIAMVENWGKLAVTAKDTPGFIVNRVARPFYSEAIRIVEEGFADYQTVDWAMKEKGGFRMGPFELMDFIGNDVNYAVTESVWTATFFDPKYQPSFTQKRLVEAGWFGRKSGKGYYDYSSGATATLQPIDPILAENICWRIVVMLINEAADALYYNIASRDDIDLAMTTGVNYPNGLLRWADEKGIRHCVETMDRLADEYREDRYRCSTLLRRMAKNGETFYAF